MSPMFDLENIHFSYPQRPPILSGVSLQLYPDERLCLTGHNGTGKSTLLQLMVGLLQPTSGDISAFGKIRKEEKDFLEVRKAAGFVFQDPDDQLFCPTVLEDVAFGPLNLGKSKDEVLSIVDKTLLSLGLSEFKDRITHKLSGGEKRLVALATVLAMEPQVLLLDEPTTNLDEETTEKLIGILLDLPQSMIIVSHDPHFRRRIATRMVQLRAGVVIEPQSKCKHAV
ncbi:MAG: energy-coupling factor ABC transporter ATP-binding protein [Rhodospirillales bacterium]|nr:energy-coupling factor ABC transporter ATP-binding protein [Rhodospirillales bacterium]